MIKLKPGAQPMVRTTRTVETRADGKRFVRYQVPDSTTAERIIAQLMQSGVAGDSIQISTETSSVGAVNLSLHVDEDFLRSVQKMLFVLFAAQKENREVALDSQFDTLRASILGGPCPLPIGTDLVHTQPLLCGPDFVHRLIVIADAAKGIVVGYAQFFRELLFSAVMSTDWQGSAGLWSYSLDPVGSIRIQEVLPNISVATAVEYGTVHRFDEDALKQHIGRLVWRVEHYSASLALKQIAEEELERVFGSLGQGTRVDQGMVDDLVRGLADRVAPLIAKLKNPGL